MIADPASRTHTPLRDDLAATLAAFSVDADCLGCRSEIEWLREAVAGNLNGAHWLRDEFRRLGSQNDIVRSAAELFAHPANPPSP